MESFVSNNEAETSAIAAGLAARTDTYGVYFLTGPVGAGKSVFARAFIQSIFGQSINVPSPTYTLVQRYEGPEKTVSHFDLYRLRSTEELLETGWDEAVSSGIVLVEWPEKLGPYAPSQYISINIEPISENVRRIGIDDRSKTA